MTTTLDLMPVVSGHIKRDLVLRWAPTGTQIDSAKRLLHNRPDALVLVALILIGKSYGFWTTDIEVRPVDGAWLAASPDDIGPAREAALTAAATDLGTRTGTLSWCVIKPDGSWYLFEQPTPTEVQPDANDT